VDKPDPFVSWEAIAVLLGADIRASDPLLEAALVAGYLLERGYAITVDRSARRVYTNRRLSPAEDADWRALQPALLRVL
jgi:hypothetical protein